MGIITNQTGILRPQCDHIHVSIRQTGQLSKVPTRGPNSPHTVIKYKPRGLSYCSVWRGRRLMPGTMRLISPNPENPTWWALSYPPLQTKSLQHRAVQPQDPTGPARRWQNWPPTGSLYWAINMLQCLALLLKIPSFQGGKKKVNLGLLWEKREQDCENIKWIASPHWDHSW